MASLGQELKKAREERGVTLHEIAESTNIGVRFLQAIESDSYGILPGGIFSRAFVRKFAAKVGLDEEQALRLYEEQLGDSDDKSSRKSFTGSNFDEPGTNTGNGLLLSLVALIILAACAYLAYEYFKAPVSEPEINSLKSSNITNPPAETTTSPLPSMTPSASPAPPVEGSQNPAGDQKINGLKLSLTAADASCWVLVVADASKGQEQTLRPGETGEFTADEKLVLNMGNLPALKITINGRVINHAKLVPNQKGIVARNVVITKDNYQQFVD